MSPLQHGLTPKMKPLSPKRTALIAALDVGTSKVACLIARLKPNTTRDTLRRRSHSVEVLGFGHTSARGMKAGAVIDLTAAEAAIRQAVDGWVKERRSRPELVERAQQILGDIDREASARRGAIEALLGSTEQPAETAKSRASRARAETT